MLDLITKCNFRFNHRGIWHAPMIAIGDGYIDFLSITYEVSGDSQNTIEYEIPQTNLDL